MPDKRKKTNQIKVAGKAIRFVLSLALLGGMIGIPAWIVYEGYSMTLTLLAVIWTVLGIPLAILLALDVREMRREEQEQKLVDFRREERLRKENWER